MKADGYGRKPGSLLVIVFLTVILTLLLAGGTAYFMGYLRPSEPGTGVKKAASSHTKKEKILYWRAPMNPTEIYDKPGKSAMGMDLVPVYEDDMTDPEAVKIDPVTQQNMGIRLAKATKGPLIHTLRTYGHITPDETLTAQVNLKTSGWIEKLHVDFTGKYVKKGEPLFDMYSPELVAAQEEYLVAFRTVGQSRSVGRKSLLGSSRNRLRFFDVPESEIEALEKSGKVKKTVMIRSPLSGFVIRRNAEEGAYIKAGTMVFRIADLSQVWVDAHIYEYELSTIKKGQQAEMTLPYLPGKIFSGTVAYVYPYLQPKTRDLVIRLVFQNPEMELKPEMYADIRIKTVLKGEGLTVPSEAVIRTGRRNVVFISSGNGKFIPRDVILGPLLDNERVQVQAGLTDGESVVISGQFLLDSESNLKEAVRKMLDAKVIKKAKQEEADFFEDME
ncbi:MAG: efflux RND transporter periplasmic adaptor subunit [Deltaproteobacteria bacterium]|jgi:multidrug efflux pump subunit AcrA (membrane-fusion protein)|nr:efflux RND transporter periplasmic adaptor subunit [Deltaproteobacteria bacterium]